MQPIVNNRVHGANGSITTWDFSVMRHGMSGNLIKSLWLMNPYYIPGKCIWHIHKWRTRKKNNGTECMHVRLMSQCYIVFLCFLPHKPHMHLVSLFYVCAIYEYGVFSPLFFVIFIHYFLLIGSTGDKSEHIPFTGCIWKERNKM